MAIVVEIPDSREKYNDQLSGQVRTTCFEYRAVLNKEATYVETGVVEKHPRYEDLEVVRFNDKCVVDIPFILVASPKLMIQSGIFSGTYFGSCKPDSKFEIGYEGFKKLPADWFEGVYLTDDKASHKSNKFGVKAGMNAQWWMERHLIDEVDKLGWFEWYCHYFLGRRIPAVDKRQIIRWYSFKERHTRMALSDASKRKYNPETGKPGGRLTDVYRQSLYHWGVNPYPDLDREQV